MFKSKGLRDSSLYIYVGVIVVNSPIGDKFLGLSHKKLLATLTSNCD